MVWVQFQTIFLLYPDVSYTDIPPFQPDKGVLCSRISLLDLFYIIRDIHFSIFEYISRSIEPPFYIRHF